MHLTNKKPIRSDALAASGCTDAAGAPDEIEITPAMIEAGVDELMGFDFEVVLQASQFDIVVRAIYRRMRLEALA